MKMLICLKTNQLDYTNLITADWRIYPFNEWPVIKGGSINMVAEDLELLLEKYGNGLPGAMIKVLRIMKNTSLDINLESFRMIDELYSRGIREIEIYYVYKVICKNNTNLMKEVLSRVLKTSGSTRIGLKEISNALFSEKI